MPTDSSATRRSDLATTGRIVSVVVFTFLCYLTIGIPLAVLPGFVHTDLGFGSVMAGAAISVQYLATLASRPLAGRTADTLGPKKTVLYGLTACAISGVLLLASALAAQWHAVSLALLIVGRLVLGFGESWVGTGSITWGIGRVGVSNNAKVISWNGIATYGALAIGAPLGVAIDHSLGFAALGFIVIALGLLGYWLATRMAPVPVVHGERMSYRSVFFRVLPHGLGLALGSVGFGSIATFITLFYAAHNWPNAALSLTVFGTMFVGARLLFANTIKAYGGFRVAIVSFAFECAGLLMLWLSADPTFALAGAALTGFRLRARVSGARRRGGRAGAAREPWRGAVGVFGVSRLVARAHRAARGLCRGRVWLWIGVPVRGRRGGAGCRAGGRALYAHGARRRRAGDRLSCDPDEQTTLASVSVFYCLARAATRYSDVEVPPRAVIETSLSGPRTSRQPSHE